MKTKVNGVNGIPRSLYSSHLTHWRQQRDRGLAPHRRGPKSQRDPLFDEVRKLKRENGHLTQRLARAELIIDVQKVLVDCGGFPWRRSTATRATHERRRPGCSWIGSRRRL